MERGARLVASCGTRVVLQMPRGNLEGIHPRIMLLQQVIGQIEKLEFGRAFRLLRQHKLDINLLHDVNPIQFLLHIDQFVAEVNQVDHLNLFINSLVPDQRGKELEFMREDRSVLIENAVDTSTFKLTEQRGLPLAQFKVQRQNNKDVLILD